MKEAESKIFELNKKLKIFQSYQATYIPVKGDEVDEALANYINNYNDKGKL